MKIIGLCGGSGSGKSFASKCFANRGIPALDTDELYHSMISHDSECTRELVLAFGEHILNCESGIDRRKLADEVFSDSTGEKRKKLNSITHNLILKECRKWLSEKEKTGCPAAIIDAPLLFESGFDKECDVIVCVEADEATRIKRITERDKISDEMAIKRIKTQADDEFLEKNSDFIIKNSQDVASLDLQVEKICRLILR